MYAYIASTLKQHDRDLTKAELGELVTKFTDNGITGIDNLLESKRRFHQKHPFLVRIADANNKTIKIYLPAPWTEFNVNELSNIVPKPDNQWIVLKALGGNHKLEVASKRLSKGFWIQVGVSSADRNKILFRLRTTFGKIFGPMVIFGLISGWLFAYYMLRPIHNLVKAVKSVRSGNIDAQVPLRGTGDELDELALHFNSMLQRVATLLKSMKDCLDNVAHDLRTPVTRLKILAERALELPQNAKNQYNALSSCAEEADRINSMLNTLLNISEAESGILQLAYEDIDIYKYIVNIVDAYRLVADEKRINIIINGDKSLIGRIDPNRMSQAMANLLDNAIKYTPQEGNIHIDYSVIDNSIQIRIQDDGIGITPDDLEFIWDRLYRGKNHQIQDGLGLGLSQAKAIIEAHRGSITINSTSGKGSVFTINIPVSDKNPTSM